MLLSNGKSGCKLEIINKNFDFFIRKTASNISYNNRLLKQAYKQAIFYDKSK